LDKKSGCWEPNLLSAAFFIPWKGLEMSLTSASSITDAIAQYNDNLLWEGDATKSRSCLEAIRFILGNRAARMASDGESLDYESMKDQAQKIEGYLAGSTTTVQRTSFTQGRMLT
jgi:hypothetical protein